MHIDLARENFTSHGLHLRNSGKDKLVTSLIGKIETHLQKTQAETLISLAWKKDTTINSADEQGIASVALHTIPTKRRQKTPTMRSKFFLWE
jgi:hypothetical protein